MSDGKHRSAESEGDQLLLAGGLLTIRQASEFLQLSRSTLYELMNRGELPFVRIRTARRIPRAALVALAARELQGGHRMSARGVTPGAEG